MTCLRQIGTGLILVSCFCIAHSAEGASSRPILALSNGIGVRYVTSADQSVEYDWLLPEQGSRNSLGNLRISTNFAGKPPGEILLSPTIAPTTGEFTCTGATVQTQDSILLTFTSGTRTVHVSIQPGMNGNVAAFSLAADAAIISYIDIGGWPQEPSGRDISVPYYSQPVHYFDSLDVFANSYLDWTASNATTFTSGRAQYLPKTDGSINVLAETIKLSVSDKIDDVLPVINNPASGYMQTLAGKMIVDIRAGTFAQITAQLNQLADAGVQGCLVIVHNWQHHGYDNELPDHYPANPELGGDTGMLAISAAARSMGCLFALHENYSDYYPNYSQYTESAVARNGNDARENAWYNQSTGIQSFVEKPTLFESYAQGESPAIHSHYGTTASFIDVFSSAQPWWRADMDAHAAGSGMFSTYRDASIAMWSYERQIHGGPVLGEGKYHWFWSGLLDGVEAQFGAESTPIEVGSQAPLFVDFDLTRIHPLQVNHGMGYYDRWEGGGNGISTNADLDAYRMQEVIFGHAPYLSDNFANSPVHALLEQGLVSPVAARYGTQPVTDISYLLNGQWSEASDAAKTGNFSQVQVTYANGDTLFANSQPSPAVWNGLEIPQFGWAAQGSDMLAYTAIQGGAIADYAQTPGWYYADARNQYDFAAEGNFAWPHLAAFQQTANRQLQLQLSWSVITSGATEDYKEFLHLVNYQATSNPEGIVLALNPWPTVPTEQWQAGQIVQDNPLTLALPVSLPDGDYSIRVGMDSPSTGARVALFGNDDGSNRYMLGDLSVSQSGNVLAFAPAPSATFTPDPRLNSTGAVVDFGSMRTDGMISIRRDSQNSEQWILSAYPRYRDVVVQLSSAMFPPPASLSCDAGRTITPVSVSGGAYWQVHMQGLHACQWDGSTAGGVLSAPAPDFQLAVNPSSVSLGSSTGNSAQIQVSASGSYSGSVSLQCSGLPAGTSCSFSPATLALSSNGAAVASILTIARTVAAAQRNPLFHALAASPVALGFSLGSFLWLRRRNLGRRLFSSAGAAISLIAILSTLTACGVKPTPTANANASSSTAPGAADASVALVTISATSADGNITRETNLTLTLNP